MRRQTNPKAHQPRRQGRRPWRSRFDEGAEVADPMAAMGTLVDVMLVFACGLIAALVAGGIELQRHDEGETRRAIERGRELPEVPRGIGNDGSGFQSVGTVYRDPESGKLILIGDETE